MIEVARCAGFSTGSLYIYFRNKQELYRAVFEARIADLLRRVETCRNMKDPAKAVTALVRIIFAHWEEKREQCRAYMSERAEFEWQIRAKFGVKIYDHYIRYLDLVEHICREGVKRGAFSGSPRLLAHLLVGMMNSTVFLWMRGGMKDSLIARADGVASFFLKGAAERRAS